MSEWVQTHLPCPCGQSSDAYSINDKGWGKCFSCGKNFNEEASDPAPRGKQVAAVKELVPFGEYRALTKRKITEETCKKFGYFVGELKDQTVQVAPYRNTEGEVIAQKVRFADKSFTTRGKFKGNEQPNQPIHATASKSTASTTGASTSGLKSFPYRLNVIPPLW
ncbi:hypothetical protein [Pseudomonas citronellolis]|uniref:hypothetical protein n=1 Tax=Pseudomonas citronellolis TaxID=53408 RepID=UPI003B97E588